MNFYKYKYIFKDEVLSDLSDNVGDEARDFVKFLKAIKSIHKESISLKLTNYKIYINNFKITFDKLHESEKNQHDIENSHNISSLRRLF